jgi:hypothetical protein
MSSSEPPNKQIEAEGAAPAIITDHKYRPRNSKEPWGLCAVCNLGEAVQADGAQSGARRGGRG